MSPASDFEAAPAGMALARRRSLAVLGRFWAWLFLAILVAFFSFAAPGFFDLFNFQAIGANMAVLAVLALGQTFVIITGGIDLSTGFVMGLATVAASLVMRSLLDEPLAIVVLAGLATCIGIGLVAGAVNGIIISRLRVPPFIATLGMLGIAQGIAFVVSGGPPVSVETPGLGALGNGFVMYHHPDAGLSFFGRPDGITGVELRRVTGILPYQIVYLALLVTVCAWLLSRTRFGRHVYAIGGNAKAAARAGIPLHRRLLAVYMLSAVLAGLAGFLYVLRYTGGVASSGDALMLSSIAAIVIGGASLMGGEGRIVGTLVGAMIIAIIQNGLVILGLDAFWQYTAVGIVIILAVLVDQAKAKVVS
jgi:ribose/xylose/arabinose/galactoside ABC-type transport system permease subunit